MEEVKKPYITNLMENLDKFLDNEHCVEKDKGIVWFSPYSKEMMTIPLTRNIYSLFLGVPYVSREIVSEFSRVLREKRGYIPMAGVVILRGIEFEKNKPQDIFFAETGIESIIAARENKINFIRTAERRLPKDDRIRDVVIERYRSTLDILKWNKCPDSVRDFVKGVNILNTQEEALEACQKIMNS